MGSLSRLGLEGVAHLFDQAMLAFQIQQHIRPRKAILGLLALLIQKGRELSIIHLGSVAPECIQDYAVGQLLVLKPTALAVAVGFVAQLQGIIHILTGAAHHELPGWDIDHYHPIAGTSMHMMHSRLRRGNTRLWFRPTAAKKDRCERDHCSAQQRFLNHLSITHDALGLARQTGHDPRCKN